MFDSYRDLFLRTRNALVIEQSLIACNGIEVIGDCIYEIKQIKQQKQQQTFNATLPYTQIGKLSYIQGGKFLRRWESITW